MIDRALRESAAARFPATPSIAEAVVARLPARPDPAPRSRPVRRRALAVALAALVLGSTAVAASTLELVPGVRIGHAEALPHVPFTQWPAYGRQATLDELRRAPFTVAAPTGLGDPDEAYVDRALDGSPVVTLVYAGGDGARLVLTQWESASVLFDKLLTYDTSATYVDVHGAPGIWIEGTEHAVFFVNRAGATDRVGGYLAGNVLVWQRGRVTYRMELGTSRERALELSGTLRPVR